MYNEHYLGWKKWQLDNFGVVTKGSRFYYDLIFKNFDRNAGIALEIGFGNGDLLAYLQGKGYSVIGLELNSLLVDRATAIGLEAYLGFVTFIEEIQELRFSLIAAFSVVEHMNELQLNEFFSWASKHLDEGGRIYLQFPEGSSPFGLANQNGDFTHISSLTKSKIEALCQKHNLELLSYFDDYLSSNRLVSLGWFGKLLLRSMHVYAVVLKLIIRLLLYPLTTTLKLSTNSIAVIGTPLSRMK